MPSQRLLRYSTKRLGPGPPAPPALVGKMAMGPIKFMTRDGKRVQYRDWMTDPADLKSLLTWTSNKLGINYRAIEAEFSDFSFDPRDLPALLFSGHNHFTFAKAGKHLDFVIEYSAELDRSTT